MAARASDGEIERPSRTGIVHLVRHSDPIALVGVLLSCGLAIALDVTGAASGVESLLAGLMGTTIALVLDASARAERRFQFRQIMGATEWLPGQVAQMATATAEISRRYPDSVADAEAQRLVRQLVEELEELRRGRIVRQRGDYAQVIAATDACRSRLNAVTNVIVGTRWWHTPMGRSYWEANERALERGVRLSRVFIYEQLTGEHRALLDKHALAGVDVRIAHHESLDPELLRNFIVWDGRSAYEGRLNAQAEMVSNVLMVNANEVDRFARLFRSCWEAADPYGTSP